MADLSGVNSSIRDARGKDAVAISQTGGLRRFAVDIPILGMGEVTTQVWFPHSYVEKPLHNWGMEIVGGADIPVNASPLASVLIRSWNQNTVEDSGIVLYDGCRVTIRTYSPYVSAAAGVLTKFSFTLFFEGASIMLPGT